jgi:uncharacterized protein (TIGR02001 family)
MSAAPARAEIGATASIFSDDRLRGYSVSDGRPVGILDFAYDDPSGFYADLSGTGVLKRSGNPGPLSVQLSGGYAKRLESGTSIDFGITHSTYARYSGGSHTGSYTEIYAGISRGALSSRIFLSPHYFQPGRWTAYGELDGNISPARHWSINGHLGMLLTLRTPYDQNTGPDFDWSIGAVREFGRLSLHAAWSDGAPGHDFYDNRRHSRSALVVGATLGL